MTRTPKTRVVDCVANAPEGTLDVEIGCLVGAPTYHIARPPGDGSLHAPGETWRPLCNPELTPMSHLFILGERAEIGKFRLCRACLAAMPPGK